MAERFDFHGAWRQLVVRTCANPALKAKLLADPAGVLRANGLTVPAGLAVKVVENTDKLVHLVLPAKGTPAELSDAELSDAELQQAAGGGDYNTFWKQVQDGNRPNPNG